jgi:hypothetical protein
MIQFALPVGLKPDTFASLVLTCGNIDYADKFIAKTFPNISEYSEKFEILSKYFDFKMIDRYSPEEHELENICEADYWFTLQHLLNKAKIVGVSNVIKTNIQVS